jgi:hypothetical protein
MEIRGHAIRGREICTMGIIVAGALALLVWVLPQELGRWADADCAKGAGLTFATAPLVYLRPDQLFFLI